MNDQAMLIPSRLDRKGISESRTTLTPSSDTSDKVILCDTRPCVPVIFLPGVMGTNLKSKGAGVAVRSPPNMDKVIDTIGAIFALIGWAFRDAATRQTRLNPNDTEIDEQGPIDVGSSGRSKDEARARGWGAIHRESYQGFLAYLQWQLNHPMLNGVPEGDWQCKPEGEVAEKSGRDEFKAVVGVSPVEVGAGQSGVTLSAEAFKHFSGFQYPVHAVGYNWTQSNGKSAEAAYVRIKKICDAYGAGTKAIVITHSMGGLVGRALAKLVPGGEDLIHGVIHGAQPATGAPMVTKRFRTGAEDFVGRQFFGADDAEWTAVAASSLSALELMPMPDYRDGKPWWSIAGENGEPILSLPIEQGCSAEEIYINPAWYGAIPDDSLIDPAGIVASALDAVSHGKSVQETYEMSVRSAQKFQAKIAKQYHRQTFALYADGALPTTKSAPTDNPKALMSFGTVMWKGPLPAGTTKKHLVDAQLLHDDHRGTWKILVNGLTVTLKVQAPDEPGDGTVPSTSAAAQSGNDGVQLVFKQGGYKHQFCFNHPWARWATLYAVSQIAQLVKTV